MRQTLSRLEMLPYGYGVQSSTLSCWSQHATYSVLAISPRRLKIPPLHLMVGTGFVNIAVMSGWTCLATSHCFVVNCHRLKSQNNVIGAIELDTALPLTSV
jgi:hypothetical protein